MEHILPSFSERRTLNYKMYYFVLLTVVASAFALNDRIYLGEDASRGEFPHMVSIQRLSGGRYGNHCGGAILNPRWILTAAHCFVEFQNDQFRIVAGIDSQSHLSVGQIKKVIQRIAHPQYPGPKQPYDVGLFKLESDLVFDQFVQPIPLPAANSVPTGNATLSGWGVLYDGMSIILPDRLQKIVAPIITPRECQESYGDKLNLELNICTGSNAEGRGPCVYDSGSPLVVDGKVVGVVSWGQRYCGFPNSPGVYARVSKFLDFINRNVN